VYIAAPSPAMQMIFASGAGELLVYRAAGDDELGELARLSSEQGLDELAWVIIYREGPLAEAALAARLGRRVEELGPALERLTGDGRVQRSKDGALGAFECVVPLGANAGWEAAVFDHVQAVVQTVCQRLQQATGSPGFNNLLADARHEVLADIDFAAHSRSLGALSEHVATLGELGAALGRARAADRSYVVVIDTDPLKTTEAGGWWWDVAVPEVSDRPEVNAARRAYEDGVRMKRDLS
jgi:hypothetical protein